MRVGASILLKNGYCYQSYGWNRFRPLGDLQTAIDILDEYEVDEILIVRPIKGVDSEDSLNIDLKLLSELKTITPLSFGGGIRSNSDINNLSGLPIERLCLSSAFININEGFVKNAINSFGRQAILACLPITLIDDVICVYHSEANELIKLSDEIQEFCMQYADEIIIIDMSNEGNNDYFQMDLLEHLKIPLNKIIITGGVGKNIIRVAKSTGIASSIIENRVLHSENSIDYFK